MEKEQTNNDTNDEDLNENDTVPDVKPKYIIGSTSKQKDQVTIEKDQESKLRAKFPGIKSGKSDFLQKRLSKGRVYFDSGEYNMSKTKKETRNSQKVYSKTPTFIPRDESEEKDNTSDDNVEHDKEYGEKDSPLPEPEETANQAIPTPELIFLRRATLHMPMSSSDAQNATVPDLNRRRYTAAPKGLDPPEVESSELSSLIETNDVPLSQQLSKRRATLQVPSKLAM